MPQFTEAEIEDWLQPETRRLIMTNGHYRDFTHTRVVWNNYDFVIRRGVMSSIRMLQLAIKDSKARDLPLELTFPGIVSEQYRIAMDAAEVRIRVIEEALLKARVLFERQFRQAAGHPNCFSRV